MQMGVRSGNCKFGTLETQINTQPTAAHADAHSAVGATAADTNTGVHRRLNGLTIRATPCQNGAT